MSTSYFILTKSHDAAADNNTDNQIVYLNTRQVYILPQVNLDYYAKHGLFENRLIEWCKQFCKPDQIFLDIGAHTGTYTLQLAQLCREVHSFEPQLMTYYGLCGSIALSHYTNVYAHNYGLGSEEQCGIQTLNIVSNDGGGSSLHKNTDKILRTEKIEIRTLDSMNLDRIGFIKMDVEDNELFVLMGGKNTIRHSGCPPIIFESNRENKPLFDYLKTEFGYKIIPIGGSPNMFLAALQ
jgi:FkbM family methyltransferase